MVVSSSRNPLAVIPSDSAKRGSRGTCSWRFKTMRTFIAIELPSAIRQRISDLMTILKPSGPEIRWAKPEGLHITLKFLGEISPAKAEEVKQELAAIHAPAPIPIQIEGCGYFPTERSPRVIWLGVQGGEPLAELAAKVEQSLLPLGFEKE